jgi:hypothetical protein
MRILTGIISTVGHVVIAVKADGSHMSAVNKALDDLCSRQDAQENERAAVKASAEALAKNIIDYSEDGVIIIRDLENGAEVIALDRGTGLDIEESKSGMLLTVLKVDDVSGKQLGLRNVIKSMHETTITSEPNGNVVTAKILFGSQIKNNSVVPVFLPSNITNLKKLNTASRKLAYETNHTAVIFSSADLQTEEDIAVLKIYLDKLNEEMGMTANDNKPLIMPVLVITGYSKDEVTGNKTPLPYKEYVKLFGTKIIFREDIAIKGETTEDEKRDIFNNLELRMGDAIRGNVGMSGFSGSVVYAGEDEITARQQLVDIIAGNLSSSIKREGVRSYITIARRLEKICSGL